MLRQVALPGVGAMKVKMIIPALCDALSPGYRRIKYSLFPPLGLATLAGFLRQDDEVVIEDDHWPSATV